MTETSAKIDGVFFQLEGLKFPSIHKLMVTTDSLLTHVVVTVDVDNVRRAEVKKLKDAGEPAYLKKCRWIFLKKKNRLWGKPRARLRELLDLNHRTIKAYLFKEDFDHLWTYTSVT